MTIRSPPSGAAVVLYDLLLTHMTAARERKKHSTHVHGVTAAVDSSSLCDFLTADRAQHFVGSCTGGARRGEVYLLPLCALGSIGHQDARPPAVIKDCVQWRYPPKRGFLVSVGPRDATSRHKKTPGDQQDPRGKHVQINPLVTDRQVCQAQSPAPRSPEEALSWSFLTMHVIQPPVQKHPTPLLTVLYRKHPSEAASRCASTEAP